MTEKKKTKKCSQCKKGEIAVILGKVGLCDACFMANTGKVSSPCAKKKSLDEFLEDALRDAPVIKGYTIKQLAEITGTPWSTARWHLERIESVGVVEHFDIGRAKLYSLKKEREAEAEMETSKVSSPCAELCVCTQCGVGGLWKKNEKGKAICDYCEEVNRRWRDYMESKPKDAKVSADAVLKDSLIKSGVLKEKPENFNTKPKVSVSEKDSCLVCKGTKSIRIYSEDYPCPRCSCIPRSVVEARIQELEAEQEQYEDYTGEYDELQHDIDLLRGLLEDGDKKRDSAKKEKAAKEFARGFTDKELRSFQDDM